MQIWPLVGITWISYIFGQQVAPLLFVPNLVTAWCHLHWSQIGHQEKPLPYYKFSHQVAPPCIYMCFFTMQDFIQKYATTRRRGSHKDRLAYGCSGITPWSSTLKSSNMIVISRNIYWYIDLCIATLLKIAILAPSVSIFISQSHIS